MDDKEIQTRVRDRQWMYLGPIMAAPLAHWAVTLYASAKSVRQKQILLGVGVVGSTALTLSMRLYLMYHAGYPGADNLGNDCRERMVSAEEKRRIENPTTLQIAKEAFRGFG